MDLKTTKRGVRSTPLDLMCSRCHAMTIRYWPAYDDPGDVLVCPACASLFELTDGAELTLAPIHLDGEGAAAPPHGRTP